MNKTTRIGLLAASLVLGTAHAGTVQITVIGKDGKPAVDVVVLIEPAVKVAATAAAAPIVIAQEGLRFVPFLTVVSAGSTLRFVNRDGYDHHVRSTPSGPLGSTPPVKNFELRLDAAEGTTAPAANNEYARPHPPPTTNTAAPPPHARSPARRRST